MKNIFMQNLHLNIRSIAFFCLIFLMFAAVFVRLHFGVDFTDESYYLSIPYRFFLGDFPFLDEATMHQTASLIALPFLTFFCFFSGNTTGLILYFRYLFLGLLALNFLLIFKTFSSLVNKYFLFLFCFFYALAVFLPIPTLSYNTLGTIFFSSSLCFLYLFSTQNSNHFLMLSGLFFALGVVSYSPFVLISPIIAFFLFFFAPAGGKIRVFMKFALAGLITSLPLLVIISIVGIDQVRSDISIMNSISEKGGSIQKLVPLIWFLIVRLPFLSIVSLALDYSANRFFPKFRKVTLPLVFCSVFFLIFPYVHRAFFLSFDDSKTLMVSIFLLAPFLLLFCSNRRKYVPVLLIMWVPAFFAGTITCWASLSGVGNFFVGATPGVLVSFILFYCYVADSTAQSPNRALTRVLFFVLTLVYTFTLLVGTFSFFYRDSSLFKLQHLITSGPFSGIFTTKEKSDLNSSLLNGLTGIERHCDKIIFYNDFPAGYFYSSLKPGLFTTWTHSQGLKVEKDAGYRRFFKEGLVQNARFSICAVKMLIDSRDRLPVPSTALVIENDPFDLLVSTCRHSFLTKSHLFEVSLLDSKCVKSQ